MTLEQAKRTLGISDFAEADIHGIEDYAGFMRYADPMDRSSVEILNELARYAGQITAGHDWIKFEAVCEAVQANTWQEMLDIAKDLDDYQLYDANDPEEFGELRAGELMECGKDITMEMEDFITYDYRGFGLWTMKEEGVRETTRGYVRRLSEPFPSLGFDQTMG